MSQFTEGQMALVEQVARKVAQELIPLYTAALREEAKTLSMQAKEAACETLDKRIRAAIQSHEQTCFVRVETWKLVLLALSSGTIGGGVMRLLGG